LGHHRHRCKEDYMPVACPPGMMPAMEYRGGKHHRQHHKSHTDKMYCCMPCPMPTPMPIPCPYQGQMGQMPCPGMEMPRT
jgi:hypothetical protein